MKSSDMVLYALVLIALFVMFRPNHSPFCGACAIAG